MRNAVFGKELGRASPTPVLTWFYLEQLHAPTLPALVPYISPPITIIPGSRPSAKLPFTSAAGDLIIISWACRAPRGVMQLRVYLGLLKIQLQYNLLFPPSPLSLCFYSLSLPKAASPAGDHGAYSKMDKNAYFKPSLSPKLLPFVCINYFLRNFHFLTLNSSFYHWKSTFAGNPLGLWAKSLAWWTFPVIVPIPSPAAPPGPRSLFPPMPIKANKN